MNTAELIAAIADDAEISKAKAEFALNSAIEHIIKAVTKADSVQLIGSVHSLLANVLHAWAAIQKLVSHSKLLLLRLLSSLLVKHLKIL